jgi:hypothetical protein
MGFAMTYVSGVLHFQIGKHRLYTTIDTLCKLVACVSIAIEHRLGRDTKWPAGANAGFECAQFDLTVQFPLVGPVESLMRSKTILAHQISVVQGRTAKPVPGSPNFKTIHSTIIIPLFVQFFENNREWLDQNISPDYRKWPAAWQFARRIRDAASHKFKLSIDDPKFVPVTWHRLTYGPTENGRSIFELDLSFGDLFILMVEMSDSLDAHGAPI